MYFNNTFIIETFVFVKNSPYICRVINHKIIMQDGTHGIKTVGGMEGGIRPQTSDYQGRKADRQNLADEGVWQSR